MSVVVSPEEPKNRSEGWLWKFSCKRSVFGRNRWKLRYVISNEESIEYHAVEPFDKPKHAISWEDVTSVYDVLDPSTLGSGGDQVPPQAMGVCFYYFGITFRSKGGKGENDELTLAFRSDREADRTHWVRHLRFMMTETERLREVKCIDEEEAPKGRVGLLNLFRLKLRNLVSLKKQRVKDGMDLDLAYILPNVIAMGYPAEGREANYRNPMTEVTRFFEKYHGKHFRIYNLCSERSYPRSRFGGRFVRFPFDDHTPAPMELLLEICQDIHKFLSKSSSADALGAAAVFRPLDACQGTEENVVSIHCKAGKGRTGLVLCCYLLYSGICKTADGAMGLFGDRRTKDGKGVAIPSQMRYIKYFEQLIHVYQGFIPRSSLIFEGLTVSTTPKFDADGGCDPFVIIRQRREDHQHRCLHHAEGNFSKPYEEILDTRTIVRPKHVTNQKNFRIDFNYELGERDDFVVELRSAGTVGSENMCSFWLHAGFLSTDGKTVIPKPMIDDAVKDKECKHFSHDFEVTVRYALKTSTRLPKGPSVVIPALAVPDSRGI
jgi:phosphatidylinositol-3,4,5-trisphosphate 3-phosphatase/dual-specificity protein phosphatase PTEN